MVTPSALHFTAYDGNGNLTTLVDATAGNTITARYEYGPFGELIRKTGTFSASNPFRFSTKFQDDESDLIYYGYRYYSPGTGRWLTRDPIEEKGGASLYLFVQNSPTNLKDSLGLDGGMNEDLPAPPPGPWTITLCWKHVTQQQAEEFNRNLIMMSNLKAAEKGIVLGAFANWSGVPTWPSWLLAGGYSISTINYSGVVLHACESLCLVFTYTDDPLTDERTHVECVIKIDGKIVGQGSN